MRKVNTLLLYESFNFHLCNNSLRSLRNAPHTSSNQKSKMFVLQQWCFIFCTYKKLWSFLSYFQCWIHYLLLSQGKEKSKVCDYFSCRKEMMLAHGWDCRCNRKERSQVMGRNGNTHVKINTKVPYGVCWQWNTRRDRRDTRGDADARTAGELLVVDFPLISLCSPSVLLPLYRCLQLTLVPIVFHWQ